MSKKKIFPIRQGVACSLKWSWNTIRLMEGTSSSCHRVKPNPLDVNNFDNFHNDPVWLSHRELQLSGIFPSDGCQYCQDIELSGGFSDRLLHLNDQDLYPVELDDNPLTTVVSPSILEVFINNKCNMACIYCDESNSTRIQNENKKFGYNISGIPANEHTVYQISRHPQSQLLVEKFFLYLDKNYKSIKRLQILGGEPFYQTEFYRLVEFLKNNENKDIIISVVTNLMVSKTVLEKFLNDMKELLAKRKIKRLDITASVDGLGQDQAYVRYGLNLSIWKENFEFLSKCKWLYLSVNSTITSLSLKSFPDLIEYINNIRKIRNVNHTFGIVDNYRILHPNIFGKNFFDVEFTKVLKLMPHETDNDLFGRKYMEGIWKFINASEKDIDQQRYLKYYLNEIDRRRGTNWKEAFPWLIKEFESIE